MLALEQFELSVCKVHVGHKSETNSLTKTTILQKCFDTTLNVVYIWVTFLYLHWATAFHIFCVDIMFIEGLLYNDVKHTVT